MNEQESETLCRKLHYYNSSSIGARGLNGGLLCGWKDDLTVRIIDSSQRHIELRVESNPQNHSWTILLLYSQPSRGNKENYWNSLITSKTYFLNTPWIVIGDFSDITSTSDYEGTSNRVHT
uniref:Uncharacterized protein n=1 Tax=Nelumbo nucifera TaxID=4432 RepID=A0A822Z850_NELNU|nr:TPA_asm: hypothetical protein HUJ06_013529 [Nelumbo nucifera]